MWRNGPLSCRVLSLRHRSNYDRMLFLTSPMTFIGFELEIWNMSDYLLNILILMLVTANITYCYNNFIVTDLEHVFQATLYASACSISDHQQLPDIRLLLLSFSSINRSFWLELHRWVSTTWWPVQGHLPILFLRTESKVVVFSWVGFDCV